MTTTPAVTEVTDTDLDQVQGGILIGIKPAAVKSPRDPASGLVMTQSAVTTVGLTTAIRTR